MYTSPANEFLLHKCRNNRKINFIFSNLKKFTSPANEFLLQKCRNKRKMKKYKRISNLKKFTDPADEFLLHRYINNEKLYSPPNESTDILLLSAR